MSLLSDLGAQIGNTVFVWTSGGNAHSGTLVSVDSTTGGVTVIDTKEILSDRIEAFST